MLTKAQQLQKNSKLKDYKRLTKSENIRFRNWIFDNVKTCQICQAKPPEDNHHLNYGCYGADKNDTVQIAVCRACHMWCHSNKRISQQRYEHIARNNWKRYNEQIQ